MNYYMGPGFGIGFGVFEILFAIVFLTVLAVFVVTFIKGIGRWNKNNHSPRLTVPATLVAKRADVSHHCHRDGAAHSNGHTYTSYYVTFQVDSGDRMEFSVDGRDYGFLVEGDRGNLSFQGTRYLGFERT